MLPFDALGEREIQMRPLSVVVLWTALIVLLVSVGTVAAQQSGRIYKLGWLWLGRPGLVPVPAEKWAGDWAAYRDVLRDAGFVLGKNLVVEQRHASGDESRLMTEAEALVGAGVDAIVTQGTPPTVAAMQATKSIPIVFYGVGDPVEKGVIASLGRPGGNVTGMAVQIAMPKQWQLLHDVAPAVRRAGFLGNAGNVPAADRRTAFEAFQVERMRTSAAAVGIEPIRMRVNSLGDVEPKFAALAAAGDAGVVVVNDALLVSQEWRPVILELALKYRLPTSCAQSPPWASSGCLVTYIENWNAILRGAAAQTVKVFKGAAPDRISVEQPTDYNS